VSEWVGDRYGPYAQEALVDPTGPEEGSLRVLRGGGFREGPDSLRVTARHGADPSQRSEGVGFRCVEAL
jgi:formylglycine-generating enzyme required for sulfatase activity